MKYGCQFDYMCELLSACSFADKWEKNYMEPSGHIRGLNADETKSVKILIEKVKEIREELRKWDFDSSRHGRPYKHGVCAPVLISDLDRGRYDVKIMKRNGILGPYYIFRLDNVYKKSSDNNIYCVDMDVDSEYRLCTCDGQILQYFDTLNDAMEAAKENTADRLCTIFDTPILDITFHEGKKPTQQTFKFQRLSVHCHK